MHFCSVGGFCFCKYTHIQVHIKNCRQVHFYTFYTHLSFFTQSRNSTLKLVTVIEDTKAQTEEESFSESYTDFRCKRAKPSLVQSRMGRGNEDPSHNDAFLL